MTEPVAGRKPVLALLMRLLWAAALALPALGAQAAVVFTSLYSFGSVQDTNGLALDGGWPFAGLVQGSDGYFYGTTGGGGTNGAGTVFKISTNGTFTSLYSFTGGIDGEWPYAALVQGRDGYFYGTTRDGGTNGLGTVFKISTNGTLTSLYSFTGSSDGSQPYAGLVQGRDGYFYGTTEDGGNYSPNLDNSFGTVFRISTNGVLTSLYSFPVCADDGANPQAALVQGSDCYFYGTTAGGNNYPVPSGGNGTVFQISTNGALSSLYSFPVDANDGANPQALVQGKDGYFYGTTAWGGTNGWGTVFKISTNGTLTSLYSFGSVQDTSGALADGASPQAGLVQGSDGFFYGTTSSGGIYERPDNLSHASLGTVFRISTNGALTTLYSFSGIDGAGPVAGLVQGSDGNFYGTTQYGALGYSYYHFGGGTGKGTVFRLTIVPQPQLTLIPSGPYMVLTWPTNYTGFTLQSTTNLGSSAVWSTNSSPPIVIGGDHVVINTISGRQQFYRLSQ